MGGKVPAHYQKSKSTTEMAGNLMNIDKQSILH